MTIAVQKLPIDELCVQVTSGGTPSRKNAEYWQNGNINWLKTGELNDWYVGESEEKINQKGLDGSSAKLFPANTVLMAMYGDGKTITTLGVLNRPATTNQACCAMIVDGAKCNYLYLLYALKHHRNELLKLVVAGAQRNLSTGIIKKFPVTYFPLPKQERIADYLSSYDKLIENNRRRIQLLEESARLLYQEWFVHLRFPGHEQVKITDGVPEGWELAKVRNLGVVITGKTPSTKDPANFGEHLPFIKTPDMHDSSIVLAPSEYLSEKGANTQKNKTLPPNSILVACIGAKLGVVALNAVECQTNQQINAVVPKEKFLTYFSYFTLKGFRQKLLAIGGGATMPNVNKAKFESMDVIIPDNSLLNEFHSFCNPIFKQMKTLLQENIKLSQARDLLLPKLMSGELTI